MEHEERVTFESDDWVGHVGILSMPSEHAPIVIISHGLGSSKDGAVAYGLQHALHAHGIGSFRIDLFGHGESQGQFVELTLTHAIKSIEAAQRWLRKRHPHSVLGLCGSSFGGSASYFALGTLEPVAVALIAPNLYYKANRDKRHGAAGLKKWKQQGWTAYVTYAGEERRLGWDFYLDLGKYDPEKLKPKAAIAFFHGDKDRIVPLADSERLAKRLKASLKAYKGVGHNFETVESKDALIGDVAAFFTDAFALDEKHAERQ